jgi:hypothetical protein
MLDKRKKPGRLAQLVELLPYKQAVTGSSPVPSISNFNQKLVKLKADFSLFLGEYSSEGIGDSVIFDITYHNHHLE